MEGDGMTTPDFWKAIYHLAAAWCRTQVVKDVSEALPRNAQLADRSGEGFGVTALLQQMHASVGGLMHPLMYGSRVPAILRDPMVSAGFPTVADEDLAAWLQTTARLESAHRQTLAWLRSSLAGYPSLRAPQLATGSPLRTPEITTHFVWTKQEFAAGLNRQPAPPDVAGLLGADPALGATLDQTARDVRAQFVRSDAWRQFAEARLALDDEARFELLQAKRQLKSRLAKALVDDHEPRRAMPRAEYREQTMRDVLATLAGPAGSYADAFAEVDALLTQAACDVFGELVMYGEPWLIQVANVETPEPGQPIVEFEAIGLPGLLVDAGQVVWLDHQMIRDAVRVDLKTLTMNLEDPRIRLTGRVLRGTSLGWASSPVRCNADFGVDQ